MGEGRVRIVEVGPRDGLQNEPARLSAATRIAFIERLLDSGLTAIEAGSFVSPKWVPQMADTDAVLKAVLPRAANFPVLVPNGKGMELAVSAGAREIAIFTAASEAFTRTNTNCSIAESIDRFRPVLERAGEHGIRVRGYVSCVLGCPYEGEVSLSSVVDVAGRLRDLGCYEISLGDTIGVGTPGGVRQLIAAMGDVCAVDEIAVHFHNTYGQALANILAAVDSGVTVVDAAAGGLGGCPYAKGASGNVATEDVVYMLHGMGLDTGVDLDLLVAATRFILEQTGGAAQSNVYRALSAATGTRGGHTC